MDDSRVENRFLELLAQKRRQDRREWTYEDIYQATGVSTGALVRLAQQRHKMIDLDMLARLCTFLDCAIGDVLVMVKEDSTSSEDAAVNAA